MYTLEIKQVIFFQDLTAIAPFLTHYHGTRKQTRKSVFLDAPLFHGMPDRNYFRSLTLAVSNYALSCESNTHRGDGAPV